MPIKPTSKSKKSVKPSDEARLAMRREKPKSFEHYEQTQPVQLALFKMLEPDNKQYSNGRDLQIAAIRSSASDNDHLIPPQTK